MSQQKNEEEVKKESNDISEKRVFIFRVIFYIFSFIYSTIMYFQTSDVSVTLGDFGSISVAVLEIIGIMSFKWIMILSVIGLILTFFRKQFEDINKVYFIIIVFMLFVATIIKFVI